MVGRLLERIKRHCLLSSEAEAAIGNSFQMQAAPKKQMILRTNSYCSTIHFVASGCLRMFYIDDKGAEQTIQFALENWWMTDHEAFNKGSKSSFSIQAIEDTTLMVISKKDLDLLLEHFPELEKYFRRIYERAYSASLFRMMFMRLSKDESYSLFCERYPAFVQRIPQKLLASFLGFTPEYLSELRKKKSGNK